MVTCPKCGLMIEDNSIICPECGNQIVQDGNGIKESNDTLNNGDRNFEMQKKPDSSNDNKTVIVQHKDLFVRIMLLLLVVCVGYLVFSKFREKNSSSNMDSSNRVLVVYINSDSSADQSDMTQIKNAFDNGGMIKLDTNNINTDLNWEIQSYGAVDADGMYWVTGAVLNYIASRGWNLVQAPTTGLVNCYYFTK